MKEIFLQHKLLLQLVLISLGVGVGLWLLWFLILGQPLIGIDDASIFKVYAQNLTHGLGFVYQPGGPRVEGFTSMLYLLLLTSIYKIVGNLDWAGLLLSFSLYLTSQVLMVLIVWRFVQKQTTVVQQWLVGLSIAWIIASPFYTIWLGLAQMDVSLWTCLVLACVLWCVYAKKRNHSWYLASGVLIQMALVLTRPEGMLLAGVPVLALVVQRLVKDNKVNKNSWIGEILLFCSWFVAVGSITAFREWYFGWPLPNTYYAKVSPDLVYRLTEGFRYLWSMLIRQPFLFLVIPLLLRLFFKVLHSDKSEVIVLIVVAVLTVIPIFNGGDHFAGWRFYQPLWPLLGIGVTLYLQQYHQQLLNRLQPGMVMLVVLPIVATLFLVMQPAIFRAGRLGLREFSTEFVIASENRTLGSMLSDWPLGTEEGRPAVGVITAGSFALTYQGTTFDLLGLNELSIAHDGGQRKGLKNHASLDAKITLEQQPELLFPTLTAFGEVERKPVSRQVFFYNRLFAEALMLDERFRSVYQPVWFARKVRADQVLSPKTEGVVAFVRADYLEQLSNDTLFEVRVLEFSD
ncbi:hypothetical protein KC921_00015 [Candidatus Woesebacteria bacterium]|nr:hypothetical protein [Candidatus Woesebacteria bacterium]